MLGLILKIVLILFATRRESPPRGPVRGEGQWEWVPGYRRRDGRYVSGHWRRR